MQFSKREGLTACYVIKGKSEKKVSWTRGCSGYRLPTEAEWEYAARAGTQTAYAFGDDAAKLGEYGWYKKNSVHAVGSRKANAWGIYDMHGNVWEWVWDWYGPYEAKQPDQAVTDPTGPPNGSSKPLRGGSFLVRAWFLRSAFRNGDWPTYRYWYNGLRCVRGPRRQP